MCLPEIDNNVRPTLRRINTHLSHQFCLYMRLSPSMIHVTDDNNSECYDMGSICQPMSYG